MPLLGILNVQFLNPKPSLGLLMLNPWQWNFRVIRPAFTDPSSRGGETAFGLPTQLKPC